MTKYHPKPILFFIKTHLVTTTFIKHLASIINMPITPTFTIATITSKAAIIIKDKDSIDVVALDLSVATGIIATFTLAFVSIIYIVVVFIPLITVGSVRSVEAIVRVVIVIVVVIVLV
jgi:hypothetical protein